MIEFKVSGDLALWTDPFSKIGGEKRTYPVPTREAVAGLIRNIYWKPSFTVVPDQIRVMRPIRYTSMGKRVRNVFGKNKPDDIYVYTYLTGVEYQIQAHYEWDRDRPEYAEDWDSGKHNAVFDRSILRGGRLPVWFGCSECPAVVEPCRFGSGVGFYDDEAYIPFGMMVQSLQYAKTPIGKAAKVVNKTMKSQTMQNGVIDFNAGGEVFEVPL